MALGIDAVEHISLTFIFSKAFLVNNKNKVLEKVSKVLLAPKDCFLCNLQSYSTVKF